MDILKDPLHGKNITLRPLREEDAAFFAHWYNEPEVMFECGFHEPTTLEAELKRIKEPENNDEDWYAIVDSKTGRLIGETGLLRMWPHWFCTDMSMIIPNPNDQGKGYGTEAAHIMLDRIFNHYNLNRVSIGVVGLNTQALKYWERLGFIKEGIQEQGYFYNGEYSDFIMMRILKSEYNGGCHV
ncbi:MAG: GNAT family N-acetyltransferase [Oscillospiraceae bacterium]|nr:GNAT family N-acetyltransferase [Oscillospiraceae bacterium]